MGMPPMSDEARREIEQYRARSRLLRSDPGKFLDIANEEIRQNPRDPSGYLHRHWAWDRLGRADLALADLATALSIKEHPVLHLERGMLLARLHRHSQAITDFDRMQAQDPTRWPGSLGPLYRAHCHAMLGNLDAAMADCASLPDDHWMPSLQGEPGGSKQEVTAGIHRLATSVREQRAADS
jgi:tetratricopeptide (TPR) repeat protein